MFDRFDYGAVDLGDTVCVQYKNIPKHQQYSAELLKLGGCER
jgi:hypothetical protein